jgi:ParB family chromosome partitioning protein
MNPPYSAGVVDRFVAKLLDEHHAGNVPAAVVLTNNSTDTRWWQSLARRSGAVCLLAGRVRFYGPEGEKGAPLQGQTVCYLGDNTSLFTERFDEFGVVL